MTYPSWLNRQSYPFFPHFLNLPMGRMHYVDEGEGAPLVMLHGNPGWSFEYRAVIKALRATHRCVAPDYIGFGLSDKPPAWNYLPRHHAENFERLMTHLKLENITLVVNDWGGPIGLSYAIRHPEKIKRIVIMNTWLWSLQADGYYRAFATAMGGLFGRWVIRHFNFFGRVVVPLARGSHQRLTPEVHRHYYRHLATKDDRKGSYVFPRQLTASAAWLDSLWQQRARIQTIPTTVVWGMQDPAFRKKELLHWIRHWPNLDVVCLDDVGHFPQEEASDVVVEVLREDSAGRRPTG